MGLPTVLLALVEVEHLVAIGVGVAVDFFVAPTVALTLVVVLRPVLVRTGLVLGWHLALAATTAVIAVT